MAHDVLDVRRMLALVKSSTLVGIDAVPIDVECVITPGQLPQLNIVGLPTTAVKEGAVRVRSALKAVGHDVPLKKVTVNLAPADLRKPGSALDLPTALSILFAAELYDPGPLADILVLGELGLDGSIRPVPGVLAAAMLAREKGLRGVLVPDHSAAEALVVEELEVYGARKLGQVIAALAGRAELPLPSKTSPRRRRRKRRVLDMSDVRGQGYARAAIEIAVAGGHNLLLSGPPGTGKTMLAQRIPTVLPAMTRDEALETTKIYSALGLVDRGLAEERPFRAPHHTISGAALLGGGSHPHPGEISLAHNGVLFLDEVPEFARGTIEALRQPLEDRSVTISRIQGTMRFPASFLLVAASNPCPCGWLGSGVRECTCSRIAVERYGARLSGPLLDRIDLQVYVAPVPLPVLRDKTPSESSALMRERVVAARDRQRARLERFGLRCNAEMPTTVVRESCPLDEASENFLKHLVEDKRSLSARSIDRLIKVARTLADLDGRAEIAVNHLDEASRFKAVDPTADVIVAIAESTPGVRKRSSAKRKAEIVHDADAQVMPPTPDELAIAVANLPPLPAPPEPIEPTIAPALPSSSRPPDDSQPGPVEPTIAPVLSSSSRPPDDSQPEVIEPTIALLALPSSSRPPDDSQPEVIEPTIALPALPSSSRPPDDPPPVASPTTNEPEIPPPVAPPTANEPEIPPPVASPTTNEPEIPPPNDQPLASVATVPAMRAELTVAFAHLPPVQSQPIERNLP